MLNSGFQLVCYKGYINNVPSLCKVDGRWSVTWTKIEMKTTPTDVKDRVQIAEVIIQIKLLYTAKFLGKNFQN